jgi:hypothetical protein
MSQSHVPTGPKLDTGIDRRTTTRNKAKPLVAGRSRSPVSVALIAGLVSVGIEFLSRATIWSEFNLPPLKHWYALVPRDAIQFVARLIGPQIILRLGLIK